MDTFKMLWNGVEASLEGQNAERLMKSVKRGRTFISSLTNTRPRTHSDSQVHTLDGVDRCKESLKSCHESTEGHTRPADAKDCSKTRFLSLPVRQSVPDAWIEITFDRDNS